MGRSRRNRGRDIDGILLLNKPSGVTSNGILQQAKRLFGAAKAGHTGALDPLATGMLPLCFGEATKFSQYLLESDKRYQTTAKLGIRTDSSDADGAVIAEAEVPADLNAEQIEALLKKHFLGQIEQVPSMYSALKHNGQPLYKLARQGVQVEVKPRTVTIYEIELLDFRGDEIDLDIRCSKGTYIRSIVEDLGLLLGCGAHVAKLHRLDAGPFKAAQMISLDDLEKLKIPEEAEGSERKNVHERLDRLLLPAWTALGDMQSLELDSAQVKRISNGQIFTLTDDQRAETACGSVKLFAQDDGRFLGVGELEVDGILRPRRLMKTN